MIAVSNDFKNAMKNPIKELDAYISLDENNKIQSSDDLIQFKISCDTGMCKAAMRKLEIKCLGEHDLLGKWVHTGFGVKLPSGTFEYLDYGSFLVTEITYVKDTGITTAIAYDSMVKAMTPYEPLDIEYPISLYSYTQQICQACGLTLANNTFTNADFQIEIELWENIADTTYRDVLAQIAQATATTCIIKNDDTVYFKSLTDTNEELTYDNMMKLKLEPIYGEINSVVLSRSPLTGEDVFMKDDESIEENGLTEFKIDNNQILDKNREGAIDAIYNALHGISFYPFETTTEGLGWFEIADSFDIINDVGDVFNTSLFNFSITIDGGIKEVLKTAAETKTQTQYQYASSMSKKIANTEITVDKQNQVIQSLVEKVVDVSATKSGSGYLTLENAYKGQLHRLSIKGQISLLFPQSESNLYGYPLVPSETLTPSDTLTPSSPVPYGNEILYPSSNLFLKSSILLIDDTEYKLDFDFLNYINNDVCDEFVYEDGKCQIIRRVGIDSQGNKYALDNEVIEYRKDITLEVDKTSVIRLKSFDNVFYEATYLLENDYTETFATNVRLNSTIEQTAEQISSKVSKNEVVSEINQSADTIELRANRLIIDSDYFKLSEDGIITSIGGTIGGFTINKTTLTATHQNVQTPYTDEDLIIIRKYLQGQITLTPEQLLFYDYNKDGIVSNLDYILIRKEIIDAIPYTIELNTENLSKLISIRDNSENYSVILSRTGGEFSKVITNDGFDLKHDTIEILSTSNDTTDSIDIFMDANKSYGEINLTPMSDGSGTTKIVFNVLSGNIRCVSLTQTSKEENKKNFEKYTGALEEIIKTDIYKYNLDFEKDTDKKHLGFVIGDNYNYSSEITSTDKNGEEIGVDNYSMTSLCLQAIKEQQEIIENLKQRIEILESKESDN